MINLSQGCSDDLLKSYMIMSMVSWGKIKVKQKRFQKKVSIIQPTNIFRYFITIT